MSDVLTLDRGYQPVGKIPWQRAITLYYQDKVDIVEYYDDREVRSVTVTIKMPSVVRFRNKFRRRKKQVKFSRVNVYERDRGKCQYCMTTIPRHEATYDHVKPRRLGGKTVWNNIVICCVQCNQDKGGRTPEQAGMKLNTLPVRPKKLPHYRFMMTWSPGQPDSWKAWLGSMHYWNSDITEAD